jgi:hypothetical protein
MMKANIFPIIAAEALIAASILGGGFLHSGSTSGQATFFQNFLPLFSE